MRVMTAQLHLVETAVDAKELQVLNVCFIMS
jgi:hypothetical protein